MAHIVLDQLTKIYPGGVPAVKDISLEIEKGEFLAILGPSGCGKTTVLRLLAGLEEPTGGRIFLGGEPAERIPPGRRGIAMVFQNLALYPHMTVRGNLEFGLGGQKLTRDERAERVREIAGILGIEDLLSRPTGALSGGQAQRVALGRALVGRPGIFLLDEPLAHLDSHLRVQMRAELRRLHSSLRTTTIHVTHDQEEAMALGDRILVLRAGSVQQTGSPREIYDHPANRFVAGFVGSPPMNFLPGRLREEGENLIFEIEGASLPLPPRLRQKAATHGSREAVLGIRPEQLILNPGDGEFGDGESARGFRLQARVSTVELLGNKKDVHLTTTSGAPILLRLDSQKEIREGENVVLAVDPSVLHLF